MKTNKSIFTVIVSAFALFLGVTGSAQSQNKVQAMDGNAAPPRQKAGH